MPSYLAHSFSGLAPHPLNPVTDTVPWLRRQGETEDYKRQAAERLARHNEIEQSKQKTGFLAQLDRFAVSVGHQIDRTACDLMSGSKTFVHGQFDDAAARRYRDNFQGSAEEGEQFLSDFRCRVSNSATDGSPKFYDGWLLVTSHRILFVSSSKLTFYFPLTDLVSIQKALVNRSYANELVISGVPTDTIIPQCLQLYTRQAAVHQFFAFHSYRQSKEATIRDAHSSIDFAWRARVQVPNPSYSYLPAGAPLPITYIADSAHAADSDGLDQPPMPHIPDQYMYGTGAPAAGAAPFGAEAPKPQVGTPAFVDPKQGEKTAAPLPGPF